MDSGERKISVICVAAYVLWTLTFVFILAGTVIGLATSHYIAVVLALMAHGLALSAAAATVTIQAMLAKQNRLLRSAFDLGRDSVGSGGGSVRRMH